MTPPESCHEAARRGLRLERRGDMLAVIPAKRCPPEFADTLRQHKREILSLLEGQAAGLTPDCTPGSTSPGKSWPVSLTARTVPPLPVSLSGCKTFGIRCASVRWRG